MRPADTTRTPIFPDRYPDPSRSTDTCQDTEPSESSCDERVRILLFDSDSIHAEPLANLLKASRYAVTWSSDILTALNELRRSNFKILIISSRRPGEWKTHIDRILQVTSEKLCATTIVCLARKYGGPQERLEAERRGVRLVYER